MQCAHLWRLTIGWPWRNLEELLAPRKIDDHLEVELAVVCQPRQRKCNRVARSDNRELAHLRAIRPLRCPIDPRDDDTVIAELHANDNERGKGDHRHVRGRQQRYRFVSVEKLVEDFLADVARERSES